MTSMDLSSVYSLLSGLSSSGLSTGYGTTGYGTTGYGTTGYGTTGYGTTGYGTTGYGSTSTYLAGIDNYGSSSNGFGGIFSGLASTLSSADYMINTGGYINNSQTSSTQQLQAQGMQKAMETSQLRSQYYAQGYTKAQVDEMMGVTTTGTTTSSSSSDDQMMMTMMMTLLPQLMGGDGESSIDTSALLSMFG